MHVYARKRTCTHTHNKCSKIEYNIELSLVVYGYESGSLPCAPDQLMCNEYLTNQGPGNTLSWLHYSLVKLKDSRADLQNLINGPPLIIELERQTWAQQDRGPNQINSMEIIWDPAANKKKSDQEGLYAQVLYTHALEKEKITAMHGCTCL